MANETIPMCLLCEKTVSNHAMKLATKRDHLKRIHYAKKNKGLEYFKIPKQKLRALPNLNTFFNHLLAVIVTEG